MTHPRREGAEGGSRDGPPSIGILGGGQLARMLCMAAARLGCRVTVLDPDRDAPAAQAASAHIVAAYDDPEGLDQLASADVVTYEFENVPAPSAERIARRSALFPPAHALAVSQDRVSEKRMIEGAGLSVASYAAVDDAASLDAARERLGDIVLKTRRFGYDGKGQRLLRRGEPGDDTLRTLGGSGLVAERLVPLDAELSVIVVRGARGEVVTFDPARNEHVDGILHRSTVPSGLSAALEREARDAACRLARTLDYRGAMGVEFFVSGGRLLVNEIAPRVHNSGHWTEAACPIDQFEAHVRAIIGLPIGDGSRHADCVMENMLGAAVEHPPWSDARTRVHLYGKRDAREGRKMGHWTRIGAPVRAR